MNYENIKQFLDNYGRDNVVFCYGNNAVVDMIKNLVISANSVRLDVVVFALDEMVFKAMNGLCDVVKYFDGKTSPDKFYKCGTHDFRNAVWQCWLIGNEILLSGRSYIYMDVDIVVKENFEEDVFQQFGGDDDCVIQFNGKNACAGFYSLMPTVRTVDLFTLRFLEAHEHKMYSDDQLFFNRIIYKCGRLNVKFLDRDEYPNGKHYYENHERIDGLCKIIHFNGIRGYETKVDKMKEHNYWSI
ncbi:MAG TPA: hypothetical protein ENH82_08665 [bacterium]|nr:hypothetical protein [bacterium]